MDVFICCRAHAHRIKIDSQQIEMITVVLFIVMGNHWQFKILEFNSTSNVIEGASFQGVLVLTMCFDDSIVFFFFAHQNPYFLL